MNEIIIDVDSANGMQLSYLVCKLEMPQLEWGVDIGIHHASNQIVLPHLKGELCFSPFLNWQQAGFIIAREKICINTDGESWTANKATNPLCSAKDKDPIIAAMRLYVKSRHWYYATIPAELK